MTLLVIRCPIGPSDRRLGLLQPIAGATVQSGNGDPGKTW